MKLFLFCFEYYIIWKNINDWLIFQIYAKKEIFQT